MAKPKSGGSGAIGFKSMLEPTIKSTSIGRGMIKTSSMNKTKKRSYKRYRGQG